MADRDAAGAADSRDAAMGMVGLLLAANPLATLMLLPKATEPRGSEARATEPGGWEARARRGALLGRAAGERDGEGAATKGARGVDATEEGTWVEAAETLGDTPVPSVASDGVLHGVVLRRERHDLSCERARRHERQPRRHMQKKNKGKRLRTCTSAAEDRPVPARRHRG